MTKLSMSEEEMLKRKYTRPYEKRIAELEDKLANADYQLEGRDNEIDELKVQIKVLEQNLEDTEICENGWKNRVKELEAQNEKMKCCENCNNFMHRVDHRCNTKCKNLSEWEIKEK